MLRFGILIMLKKLKLKIKILIFNLNCSYYKNKYVFVTTLRNIVHFLNYKLL